jgi:prepilin-type N-terminal cleavage/methylation domain-containing protein
VRSAVSVRRAAFTLLEVLVAIVLIAVIVGAAFGFFWNTLASRARLEAASARALGVALLQGVLEQAVLSSEAGSSSEHAVFSASGGSMTVPCRVVRAGASGREPFARSLTLRFDESSKRLLASWDQEAPAPIVDGVASVLFRGFDGRVWNDEFNASSSGKLPAAIEVGLWWERASTSREEVPPDPADIRTERPADVLLTLRVPDAQPDAQPDDQSDGRAADADEAVNKDSDQPAAGEPASNGVPATRRSSPPASTSDRTKAPSPAAPAKKNPPDSKRAPKSSPKDSKAGAR